MTPEFPTSEAVVLGLGELVLLLTDGIVETASPSGEHFGPERALAIVRQHQTPMPSLTAHTDPVALDTRRARLIEACLL